MLSDYLRNSFFSVFISPGLSVPSFRYFWRVIRSFGKLGKRSLKVIKKSHDILIYWKCMNPVLTGPCWQAHVSRSMLAGPCWQVHVGRSTLAGPCEQDHVGRSMLTGPCWQAHVNRTMLAGPRWQVHVNRTTLAGPRWQVHMGRPMLAGPCEQDHVTSRTMLLEGPR